jgi:hypothetical protein
MKQSLAATFAAGLLVLAGCVHVEHNEKHEARRGPPPHAPAHGYRHHQKAVDLRFDVQLGVYVVIGHPNHFYSDGHYFRRVGPRWERCGSWKKGNWKVVEVDVVPVQLARHYRGKGQKHGKGHGHGHGGPAKHDD